ncbi:hypothetical protein U9M48_043346, partial [Paspalum notatum var. saurae]
PACKEPSTKVKPLLEKTDNQLLQESEDEGSLIKSVPASRGCLGQSPTTRQTNLVLAAFG